MKLDKNPERTEELDKLVLAYEEEIELKRPLHPHEVKRNLSEYEKEINRKNFYIIKEKGKEIGFVTFSPAINNETKNKYVEITRFFIAREYRGNGIEQNVEKQLIPMFRKNGAKWIKQRVELTNKDEIAALGSRGYTAMGNPKYELERGWQEFKRNI